MFIILSSLADNPIIFLSMDSAADSIIMLTQNKEVHSQIETSGIFKEWKRAFLKNLKT
jgi:hypothetical protein